jgi:hypothetical protein
VSAQEGQAVKIIIVTPEGDHSGPTSDEILRTNWILTSEPIGSPGALVDGALVYAVPAINMAVTEELGNIWAGKARVVIYGLHSERVVGP